MPTVEENERSFEDMGLASVRMLVTTGGLPQHMMNDAMRWAARQEGEERRRTIASEIEAKRIARSISIAEHGLPRAPPLPL